LKFLANQANPNLHILYEQPSLRSIGCAEAPGRIEIPPKTSKSASGRGHHQAQQPDRSPRALLPCAWPPISLSTVRQPVCYQAKKRRIIYLGLAKEWRTRSGPFSIAAGEAVCWSRKSSAASASAFFRRAMESRTRRTRLPFVDLACRRD
jgi:hypothetical protein